MRVARFFLYGIIPYFYFFALREKKAVLEYWKILKPHESWWVRQRHVFLHFFTFAEILLDRVSQSYQGEKIFFTQNHGIENLLSCMKKKQGVLILTSHTGAWSLASYFLRTGEFHGQFLPVEWQAEGMTFEMNLEAEKKRISKKIITNQTDLPVLEIYRNISEGKPVGLMMDRPRYKDFGLVPFFKKLIPVDLTPFRIAAILQCPVIFSFAFKTGEAQYDFYACPARFFCFAANSSEQEQLCQWASEFMAQLEKYLERYPYQWFNFFSAWSTRPSF